MEKNVKSKLNEIKSFCICLLTAVVLACGGLFCLFYNNAQASNSLKAEYMVGEVVEIPSKQLEGVDALATVIYPSGSVINSSKITLNEAGKYTVKYTAVKGGKALSETVNFNAYNSIYTFSGNKSTASYGEDTSQYKTDKTALNISLANGESLYFNKIIDLNALNGKPFISFYATPRVAGVAEVQGIYFTLTDIYDESNTVTFQYKNVAYTGDSSAYICAYMAVGYGDYTPRAWAWDGSKYFLRIGDKFGTASYMSLYGTAEKYGGLATKDSFAELSIDMDTKKAFVSDAKSANKEIIDLDKPEYFDIPWSGFTTGEVRLSVEAYDYTGSTFNLNVTDVAGHDFANEVRVDESDAPVIVVDADGYDLSSLPMGSVGNSYKVFSATAFDNFDGFIDVETVVSYGVDSAQEIQLDVVNGEVETPYSGKYKITYKATDRFGNSTTEAVYFYVDANPSDINLSFVGQKPTSCKIGETVALPDVSVSGGAGELSVSITADKEAKLDQDSLSFIPLQTGAHTITYTVSDMTGFSKTESFVINVAENPVPVVVDKVIIPNYLYGGLKYQFPTVKAYDFNTKQDVDTTVYVDGVKCDNNLYTPTDVAKQDGSGNDILGDTQTVVAQYKVGNEVVLEKQIKVLDVRYKKGVVKNFDLAGYWIRNDFAKKTTSDGIEFTLDDAAVSTASIDYSMSVLLNAFSVGLDITSCTNVQRITVKLIDVANESNAMTISLVKDAINSKTVLYVDGEQTIYSFNNGGFYGTAGSVLHLSYSNGKITDGQNINYVLTNGFDAERVYFSIIAEEITSGSNNKIVVSQVCSNVTNSSVKKDEIEPIMILNGKYADYAKKGDDIVIASVSAMDNLDCYVKATVTVKLATYNGTTITLLNNVDATKEYTVTAQDFGEIIISYNVEDGSGLTRKPRYTVAVNNDVAPEIFVNESSIKSTYKVGQKIKFPTATATDDLQGEISVKYFVVTPALRPLLLEDGTFTPKSAGDYVFRIYAVDDFGNITLKDINFKVVK